MNPILMSLIGLVITVPLSALVLMISAKIFKLSDVSYKTAFIIAVILGIATFIIDILIATVFASAAGILGLLEFIGINIVLAIVLIQKKYSIELKKALLVWLVWFLLSLVVIIVVSIVVGIIIALVMPLQAPGY